MRARALLAVVGVAVTVAATASAAMSGTTTLQRCGTVTFDGKALPVFAQGVPCSTAKTLIKKLAAKPHPGRPIHVYPGTYLGMRCKYSNQIGKSIGVLCNNADYSQMVSAGKKTG